VPLSAVDDVDATVYLHDRACPESFDLAGRLRDLRQHRVDELLTSEAGEDRHQQHDVHLPDEGGKVGERRVGVGDEADAHAEVAGLGEQVFGVADLHMHGAAVGPGFREVGQILRRIGDHEMAVHEQLRVPTK
jgi:hypothetical protein